MTEPTRSPFLDVPGAVESEESGVAAHYGQPLIEQRALDEGDALVDLSHEGVITVSGADRLTWLDSMTSQELKGLRPGDSAETLLLDPNGRIQHVIRLTDDGERAWLLVDAGTAEALFAYLQRMRFALRVEVNDVSREFATLLAFDGPLLAELRDALSVQAEWRDPWAGLQRGGHQYADDADHPTREGWTATRLVFPRHELANAVELVKGRDHARAGLLSLSALEIHAWRPTQSGDVDERAIPNEFDWLRSSVHMTKGCYRGQETIAKVHNIGHPPRRFTMLHLDGSSSELPEPGALIRVAGEGPEARPIGRITRAALHYEWGGIALALMKRTAPADAEVDVDLSSGGTLRAAQQVIVPPSAGATRNVPRLRRLG